ncbi:site-specific integrase [Actinoplanes sp. NPDC023801]|uniref:site-specific integrase n=1 Tax=Actinoplanes sp. NPDC023801 TaxID=3154595 RepID=UPI003402C13F
MFVQVDRVLRGAWMSLWSGLRLVRSRDAAGGLVVQFGVALLDTYLEFLAVRSRPNTVVAVAYDLKVFFAVVGKAPGRVVAADVLAFVTAQYAGGPAQRLQPAGDGGGVSARTVRRRLSSVSGLFAFLQARGDVEANPVPRGLPTRRERQRPRQGVPLVRTPRTLPRILPAAHRLRPQGLPALVGRPGAEPAASGADGHRALRALVARRPLLPAVDGFPADVCGDRLLPRLRHRRDPAALTRRLRPPADRPDRVTHPRP